MSDKTSGTWVPFFEEFANKLLAFKNDRAMLIGKLQSLYMRAEVRFPRLEHNFVPEDIDPYTVMGVFNKQLSDVTRCKLVASIAEEFSITAAQPSDFNGVPLLNNMNATFYAFSGDARRKDDDIDALWNVFEAELALADGETAQTRQAFIAAFDNAVGRFNLSWKLTMGIYWARPNYFIALDSRNRWYFGDMAHAGSAIAAVFPKEHGTPIPDGATYLQICDTVRSQLNTAQCPQTNLPELSYAAYVEVNRVNEERKKAEKNAEDNALGDSDVQQVRYWLYAPGEGASMWDEFYQRGIMGIGWSELGDLSAYETKEAMRLKLQEEYPNGGSHRNDALATWQFAREMKPGDVVFVKQGTKGILGRGVVEGEYAFDAKGGKFPHTRTVNWTHKGTWECSRSLVTKAFTEITNYTEQIALISSCFQDEDGSLEEEPEIEYPPYTADDFLSEVYMDAAQYETLCGLLRTKKNVILQGAPGVGKTFAAKRLAYSMMGVKDAERVMMVQFHQSYSYEDFIEGFRPSADGFELANGAFYTFCKKAADDSENDYFFIIDEINRGNLSKIFGELFMLIEADKRGPRNKLQLLYSRELFYVPSNVYLIGMMNTADRSLALLDYALRRRFAFFDVRPGYEADGFVKYRTELGSAKFNELIACVQRLNDVIADDDTLGEGFCIGHSYFCGLPSAGAADERLASLVEYELIPLLKEYWFDEPAKVREWADSLRRAIR